MNKKYIIFFSLIAIVGIFSGIGVYKFINKEENSKNAVLAKGNTTEIVETSMGDETVISPNAIIILETEYEECGHTIKESLDVPQELVNKNESEFRKVFDGWEVEKFSANEIKIYKRENGNCDSHYIIRDNNGFVCVYKKTNNGEELIEKTKIAVEYLPEIDCRNVQKGIEVVGLIELNSKLEDFE